MIVAASQDQIHDITSGSGGGGDHNPETVSKYGPAEMISDLFVHVFYNHDSEVC